MSMRKLHITRPAKTNMDLAKNYKSGLLLVTGDMDNTVHPAHTMKMADALIKAGKYFDMTGVAW